MNENTTFVYENALGRVVFGLREGIWISEAEGLSGVQVDFSENQSAGQIGASVAGQSVQARHVSIEGVLFEPVEVNRQKLIDVFVPGVLSKFSKVDGDISYFLEVFPVSTPEISPGQALQNFQVQLKAPYPYWKSASRVSTQVVGIEKRFEFPFDTSEQWHVSVYTEMMYKEVLNSGNVPVDFDVVFTARAILQNPEIYHMNTRERIAFLYTMQLGDMIRVYTSEGQRRVEMVRADGAAENGFKYLTLDSNMFMKLQPGVNLLRADAAQNRQALNVMVHSPQGVSAGV